jgi:hypothetical protein
MRASVEKERIVNECGVVDAASKEVGDKNVMGWRVQRASFCMASLGG